IHLAAHHGTAAELEVMKRTFPIAPGRGSATGRAILTGDVVHIDVATDPEYEYPVLAGPGFTISLAGPELPEGSPIRAITVARQEGRPFSANQIALLRTFADQAVIAVENVHLFQELAARNRELSESLEQQTATSEILRAISASPTDTQPVFDTIAQRALRVCDGTHCAVMRSDGTRIR